MNFTLETRTAALRCHDTEDWRAWQHSPMALWSDAALWSFCAGVPQLEAAIDPSAPTAAAIQGVIAETIGSQVAPSSLQENLQLQPLPAASRPKPSSTACRHQFSLPDPRPKT